MEAGQLERIAPAAEATALLEPDFLLLEEIDRGALSLRVERAVGIEIATEHAAVAVETTAAAGTREHAGIGAYLVQGTKGPTRIRLEIVDPLDRAARHQRRQRRAAERVGDGDGRAGHAAERGADARHAIEADRAVEVEPMPAIGEVQERRVVGIGQIDVARAARAPIAVEAGLPRHRKLAPGGREQVERHFVAAVELADLRIDVPFLRDVLAHVEPAGGRGEGAAEPVLLRRQR